jgi:hypothetical protein
MIVYSIVCQRFSASGSIAYGGLDKAGASRFPPGHAVVKNRRGRIADPDATTNCPCLTVEDWRRFADSVHDLEDPHCPGMGMTRRRKVPTSWDAGLMDPSLPEVSVTDCGVDSDRSSPRCSVGKSFVITRRARPVALLVPIEQDTRTRWQWHRYDDPD